MSREYPPRGIIRQSTAAVRHLFPDVRRWIVIGSRTGEMESIVSQREINTDTASYLTALRAALRQINGIIYTSAAENMIAMDSSILQLYKDGRIDKHTAISEPVNPEIMSKRLNLL